MKKGQRYLLITAIVAAVFYVLDDTKDIAACIVVSALLSLMSLFFDTKADKERKRAAAERIEREKQAEKERQARAVAEQNAPGCYNKDGVDILSFSSKNNVLTSGNNWIEFRLRNKNAYGVIVSVKYKYSDGWESSTHSYEVAGNDIRTVSTTGKAWRKIGRAHV